MSSNETVIECVNAVLKSLQLACFMASGDGDAWLISPEYRKWADAFEAYQASMNECWPLERTEHPDHPVVVFQREQEAVIFVPDRSHLPNWMGDIVVEVKWAP